MPSWKIRARLLVLLPVVATLGCIMFLKPRRRPDTLGQYLRERAHNSQVDFTVPEAYTLGGADFGACDFSHCDTGPYVYTFTSHKGRVKAYTRWLRSLARDLETTTALNSQCVCATVADFVEDHHGPDLLDAFEAWPYSYHVVRLSGPFSAASGHQALLERVISTPAELSMVMQVDADMVAFPGYLEHVLSHVVEGQQGYAPIVWGQQVDPEPTAGQWMRGTGNCAYFVSDFLSAVGHRYPLVGRTEWGDEDTALTAVFAASDSYNYVRRCEPKLWHMDHLNYHDWVASPNGMGRTKRTTPSEALGDVNALRERAEDYSLPAAHLGDELVLQGKTLHHNCRLAMLGEMFISRRRWRKPPRS